jgi:hypothetical protein
LLPRDEKRRSPRIGVAFPAQLRSQDLTLEGEVVDVGQGGVFMRTRLLIEIGECGTLTLSHECTTASVPVRVIWLRGAAAADGPGMGLSFEATAADTHALEQLLAILDEART